MPESACFSLRGLAKQWLPGSLGRGTLAGARPRRIEL